MKQPKNRRQLVFEAFIVAAILTIGLLSIPAQSIYRYGYKTDDSYTFNLEASSTTKTEQGSSSSSMAYVTTYTIKDINENTGYYRVEIQYLAVLPTGYPGGYGGRTIQEGSMEGDPQPFVDSAYRPFGIWMPSNMFITTDWEMRNDEWRTFVDNTGKTSGWMIKDRTASNGIFTLDVSFDVDNSQSTIDYDGNGNDAYTGTLSMKVAYDDNGVLSSTSTQAYYKFNDHDAVTYTTKVSRGSLSPFGDFSTNNIALYGLLLIVGIMTLCICFFVMKLRRTDAQANISPPPSNNVN